MTFGEKLQQLRAREGLTQDALAELLDVSRQAVSKWERDEAIPDTDKVVRLSQVFRVTTDYLLKDGPEARQTAPGWTATGFLRSLARLYREKAYLLGWLLVAWGALGLLRTIAAVANYHLEIGDWESTVRLLELMWFIHLSNLLRIAGGLFAVGFGRRFSGRFRLYHLGWILVAWGAAELALDALTLLSIASLSGFEAAMQSILPDLYSYARKALKVAAGLALLLGGRRLSRGRERQGAEADGLQ